MARETYDRSGQDVGNIVALEHVNVRIPDQVAAAAFYVLGLGLTRDPYLMVGLDNMWINVGRQQFHLPTGRPQILRGTVGLVVPNLDTLVSRLAAVRERLAGTAFAYAVEDKHVVVICPWGNRIRCHAPGPEFRDITLGLPYVEFAVATDHADGIARFYRTVFGAPATIVSGGGHALARVRVGPGQELLFRETAESLAAYDGHHIAIYLADFSGPHRFLVEHNLVTQESNEYQYRFEAIVDPDSRRPLFELQHEVRSLTHPMYLRPLVNRNPSQTQRAYARGRDAFVPGME